MSVLGLGKGAGLFWITVFLVTRTKQTGPDGTGLLCGVFALALGSGSLYEGVIGGDIRCEVAFAKLYVPLKLTHDGFHS